MTLSLAMFAASLALAAGDSGRPTFTGTWQLDAAKSEIHSRISNSLMWTIDQKDEDIHFIETGDEKGGKLEITCGTRGADCKTKEAGKKVTIQFWYNGPALVEMQTEGNGEAVTKKKIQMSEDGNTLTVDVTHILPIGRSPEKYVLTKR